MCIFSFAILYIVPVLSKVIISFVFTALVAKHIHHFVSYKKTFCKGSLNSCQKC